MNLLPMPSKLIEKSGCLKTKTVNIKNLCDDERIAKALRCFVCDAEGTTLTIQSGMLASEGYTLDISEHVIIINGDSAAGAFYGIQTLKQIFEAETVPCLFIEDKPDMQYRGFYHDVTRGKVPTLETLKKLIDTLAYYKTNSLQLYVEHTFPFKEFGDAVEKTGYLTPEEILELDAYCYDNFIEFIPSLATFGHVYELLQRDEFKELQTAENYEEDQIFWWMRMRHHTIDPKNEKSIAVIKSMIDQYLPLFKTDKFNICGDETFDLTNGKYKNEDTGKLYVDFIKQIIEYLQSKGKKVMMWGDILLKHPETITELPKDIEFLNWWYDTEPKESSFKTFADHGCTQIVCPGTSSWSRLVEWLSIADSNITKMLDYGYQYGAVGMLNTNWGDLGNPCSLELSMHGLILGAAKSWNKHTQPDDVFSTGLDALEYKQEGATAYLYRLDAAHQNLSWDMLLFCYSNLIHTRKANIKYPSQEHIEEAITICRAVTEELSTQTWGRDEYRTEMLLAAEGITVLATLFAKLAGYEVDYEADVQHWLTEYRKSWMKRNKESELAEIEKAFIALSEHVR